MKAIRYVYVDVCLVLAVKGRLRIEAVTICEM